MSAPDEPNCWLNGRLLPFSEARIPVYDVGVVHGVSVTEMIRTFRGVPFRMDEHLERLAASIDAVGFESTASRDELSEIVNQVVAGNRQLIPETHDLGIIVFVTGGPNLTYLGRDAHARMPKSTVCVHTFPLAFELWSRSLETGQHLAVSTVRQMPSDVVDSRIKSRSRLYWHLANRDVRETDSSAVALALSQDGCVTETSAANIFVVADGVIKTPARNILEGISRATVIELCHDLEIPCDPCDLVPDDVAAADEVFTTSTPCCMLPVTRFNGQTIADGNPGPVFQRILNAWSDRVGLDIARQIHDGARDRFQSMNEQP